MKRWIPIPFESRSTLERFDGVLSEIKSIHDADNKLFIETVAGPNFKWAEYSRHLQTFAWLYRELAKIREEIEVEP